MNGSQAIPNDLESSHPEQLRNCGYGIVLSFLVYSKLATHA